jgi:hypothetical protein
MQVSESKIFLGTSAKRKTKMKDEDIAQELFLDSDSDTHNSNSSLMRVTVKKMRHNQTTHSGLTIHQPAGREICCALARERDAVEASCVFHEKEAE